MEYQNFIPFLWLVASIFHFVFYYIEPLDSSIPDPWYTYTSISNYINLVLSLFFTWLGCRSILCKLIDHCVYLSILAVLLSIALALCTLGVYFLFLRANDITNADSLFWGTTIFYVCSSVAILFRIGLLLTLFSFSFIPMISNNFLALYQLVHILFSFSLSLSICYSKDALNGYNYYLTFWSFTCSAVLIYNFFITHQQNESISTFLMVYKLKRILHCFIYVYTFQGPIIFAFVIISDPHLFQSHNTLAIFFVLQLAISGPCLFESTLFSFIQETSVLQATSSVKSLLKGYFNYVNDGLIIESLLLLMYLYSHFQSIPQFVNSHVLKAWGSLFGPLLLIQFSFNYLMREIIEKQEITSQFFIKMINSLRISAEEASILVWAFWAKIWGLFTNDISHDQNGLYSFAIMVICTIFVKLGLQIFRFRFNLANISLPPQQLQEELLLNVENNDEQAISQEPNLERIFSHLEDINISQVSDRDCPICLESLKEDRAISRLIDCNHVFHSDCIVRWIKTKESCPLDRHPLH